MREATELNLSWTNDRYATVSLEENASYYVKDGKLEKVDELPKGYGQQILTWQDGKVVCEEIRYTKKNK